MVLPVVGSPLMLAGNERKWSDADDWKWTADGCSCQLSIRDVWPHAGLLDVQVSWSHQSVAGPIRADGLSYLLFVFQSGGQTWVHRGGTQITGILLRHLPLNPFSFHMVNLNRSLEWTGFLLLNPRMNKFFLHVPHKFVLLADQQLKKPMDERPDVLHWQTSLWTKSEYHYFTKTSLIAPVQTWSTEGWAVYMRLNDSQMYTVPVEPV